MAEFCKECFLKLNPEFEEKDLQLLKEEALFEGCGKIVDKIVVNIKSYSLWKIHRKRKKF